PDLLAIDAPGRNGVHRDAVSAELARESLCPGVHRRLGGESPVQALGLRLAGDVDDAAPFAIDHLPHQEMRELAMAAEVERERLFPLLVRRLEGEAAAAARIVDKDVDPPEALQRGVCDALWRFLGEEVLLDDDELVGFPLE